MPTLTWIASAFQYYQLCAHQGIIWPLGFCTSVSKLGDPNTDWAVQEGYVCFWHSVGAKGHKLAHRLKWNTHIKISRHKEGNF